MTIEIVIQIILNIVGVFAFLIALGGIIVLIIFMDKYLRLKQYADIKDFIKYLDKKNKEEETQILKDMKLYKFIKKEKDGKQWKIKIK